MSRAQVFAVRPLSGLLLALLAGCSTAAAAGAGDGPLLELVETAPVETLLDHEDIREAKDVWPEMIGRAKRSLDVAQFYVSPKAGSRLESVIEAVEAAAKRGVEVRVLADAKFYKTYPEQIDAWKAREGIEVRVYDAMAPKGVLHAKYFIVDGRELYFGSQNFDWRSLEHVQELGMRVRHAEVVKAFAEVFEMDWARVDPDGNEEWTRPGHRSSETFPVKLPYRGSEISVTPVFSPKGALPDEGMWDLPRLVEIIAGARERLRVQLLGYSSVGYRGEFLHELEGALREAACRGVKVELMVSHWSQAKKKINGLKSLQVTPNVTVKIVTLPEHSGGFINFARVIHAKLLVVDGERGWLGTSNWGPGYFHDSRNVGLLVEGKVLAAELERFFLTTWRSPYAEVVDPARSYPKPKRMKGKREKGKRKK